MNSPRVGPKYVVSTQNFSKVNAPVEKKETKKRATPKKTNYLRFNESSKQRRMKFTPVTVIDDVEPEMNTEKSVEKLQKIKEFAAKHIQQKLREFISKTENVKRFPRISAHPKTENEEESEDEKNNENNVEEEEVTEEEIETENLSKSTLYQKPRQKIMIDTHESPMKYKISNEIKPTHTNNSLNMSIKDRIENNDDYPVVTVPVRGRILDETKLLSGELLL